MFDLYSEPIAIDWQYLSPDLLAMEGRLHGYDIWTNRTPDSNVVEWGVNLEVGRYPFADFKNIYHGAALTLNEARWLGCRVVFHALMLDAQQCQEENKWCEAWARADEQQAKKERAL